MNHTDRVRAFLRRRAQMTEGTPTIDPVIIHALDGGRYELTVRDLDALCRDAERLAEVEDL